MDCNSVGKGGSRRRKFGCDSIVIRWARKRIVLRVFRIKKLVIRRHFVRVDLFGF